MDGLAILEDWLGEEYEKEHRPGWWIWWQRKEWDDTQILYVEYIASKRIRAVHELGLTPEIVVDIISNPNFPNNVRKCNKFETKTVMGH